MAGSRKKVLWVDDEIEFLRSHIMFLETRGYSVIPVFSGDDAIHIISEKPSEFDIVLLDEQMPGKDGLTTLEEIKDISPELPVVMVTKSEEEQVMEDAFGKKIDGYLTKPVNPSQILSICKSLLDSKQYIDSEINQKFIRSFSENRSAISGPLDARRWITLYENLVKWDFELERIDDEGLRQTHSGQKSDCNRAFSQFIVEHYAAWMRNTRNPPVMTPHIIDKALLPFLENGEKVYFVVMDCMRLDQFLAIESLLKKSYDIKRRYFYSILPSSTGFARRSLFAGKFPDEIAHQHPGMYRDLDEDNIDSCEFEKMLLLEKLKKSNVKLSPQPKLVAINNSTDARQFLKNLDEYEKDQLVAITVNFVDMLVQSRTTSAILKEIAPDESAFRSLTRAWFQYSTLYQILRKLADQNCTVLMTTDHGSVFCTRSTDLYGSREIMKNTRYKRGVKITSDERRAIHLSDPTIFRLPRSIEDEHYILALENYYFCVPGKFEDYKDRYENSFQQGGVSLEEMILPLAVLKPLRDEEPPAEFV
ncbi:MAG: response regulator [Chitinivibrionales bacterium]|nr:response regulator [Chitinivibrionales bacterium]